MRTESGSAAERGIVKLDERAAGVQRWMADNLKLKAGSASSFRSDADARERGRRDGAAINMGGGHALGRGAHQLGNGR